MALDVREISSFTDFLVICSGTSEPQLRAMLNGLKDQLWDEHRIKPFAMDGTPESHWIVADFGGVVAHLFHETRRGYYSLEDLWKDAPRVALEETAEAGARA